MTWLDDQKALRDVLLAEVPAPADVERLGGHPARWLVYRNMVRARFADVLADGFERFRTAVGAGAFDRLVDRFLAERPPRSPYLRDVPGEFLHFLEGVALDAALPAFAFDLARFECAELEVAHAPSRDEELVAFDFERYAALSSSARILGLEHDLSAFIADLGGAGPLPGSRGLAASSGFAVCVHRDPKTHDVASLALAPMGARILRGIERGEAPLDEIVKSAAKEACIAIDAPFVEALSTWLTDLVERGVIAGSRPRADGEPRLSP